MGAVAVGILVIILFTYCNEERGQVVVSIIRNVRGFQTSELSTSSKSEVATKKKKKKEEDEDEDESDDEDF